MSDYETENAAYDEAMAEGRADEAAAIAEAEGFDGDDETTALDGSRCKPCGGTVVAEPVEAGAPPRLRCRDCGERNLL